MKLLFEIPLESSDYRDSQFEWLSDLSNRLFLIEEGKRLKTISIGAELGKVLESANLADGRTCTSLSWNKDGNQLAMIVDKRLIYFWDVRDNNLLQYKPSAKTTNGVQKGRIKDVEHIVWSKVTNKVVIGYSSGQLLLCSQENSSMVETFIDNSNGVLGQVSRLESSPHSDMFACNTIIFELLVMTFDGNTVFYNQDGNHLISIIKFSPSFLFKESTPVSGSHVTSKPSDRANWLAYSCQGSQIYFELIKPRERNAVETYSSNNCVYRLDDDEDQVVYYEWIDTSDLMVCTTSGTIILVNIKISFNESSSSSVRELKKLEIHTKETNMTNVDRSLQESGHGIFKSFKLTSHNQQQQHTKDQSNCGKSFSLSAMTASKLYYYELIEMEDDTAGYSFEYIDELDLTGSLKKIALKLERLQWSYDSSMLAVQLTNGHILIYQTRLRDNIFTSNGFQTAYLSDPNEVTILNYGMVDECDRLGSSSCSPVDGEEAHSSSELASKASIVKIDMKPSVIAISAKYLAVGLNNLVCFYSTKSGKLEFQEEYHSIVSSISLDSKFVSVRFNDGRVKLHPLKSSKEQLELSTGDEIVLNERYFPDPTSSETVTASTLNGNFFIYCTSNHNLHVFCPDSWTHIQSLNHHVITEGQAITKLVPDRKGNKYLCLTEASPLIQCMVFLYDSYRNQIISFAKENHLYAKIFRKQLEVVPTLRQSVLKSIPYSDAAKYPVASLSRISNVIWDTDGRSILLVDRKNIHIFVVLDHTLESEGPIIEWVATIGKQSTYSTLYASHGVVSFQTSLGRVANSISKCHDDETNLNDLSKQIQAVISTMTSRAAEGGDQEEIQAQLMRLKLEYLRMIILIYPLSKCAEICEYIMSDTGFNVAEELRLPEIDDVLWRQLAARAIFVSNLRFALLVYKRRRLQVFARALSEIMSDFGRLGFDSKTSVSTRLLILLGCDIDDE